MGQQTGEQVEVPRQLSQPRPRERSKECALLRVRYSAPTGQTGTRPNAPSDFDSPNNLALDRDGNLAIT